MGVPICKECFDKAPEEDKIGVNPDYRYGFIVKCHCCGVHKLDPICVQIIHAKGKNALKVFQEQRILN